MNYLLNYTEFLNEKSINDILKTSSIIPSNIKFDINVAKNFVINQVNTSNLANKPLIIQSIKDIQIHLINKDYSNPDEIGSYINAGGENIITLSRDTKLINDQATRINTIKHELYHYIDKISGNISNSISFIDNVAFTNKTYLKNKVYKILSGSTFDENKKENPGINKFLEYLWNNKQYLTDKKEFYVRLQNLKNWLIENKFISRGNQITKEIIKNMLINNKKLFLNSQHYDFFSLIFFLDYNKTEQMNKFII